MHSCIQQLISVGIAPQDAAALRRISMTLHSWYELECGTDRGCIERDEETDRPLWRNTAGIVRTYIADRERGAEKRLKTIMGRYPNLRSYLQTDPRGCALYILRPGDVPDGEDPHSYYSRGIAVYK